MKPKQKKPRQHGVRLPVELAQQIAAIAKSENNPESAIIRRLLSLGLEVHAARERGAA
jgi:predicted DNA-binding protein